MTAHSFSLVSLVANIFLISSGLEAKEFTQTSYRTSIGSKIEYEAGVSLFFIGSQLIQGVNEEVKGEIIFISKEGDLAGELLFSADGFKSGSPQRDRNVAAYLGYPEHPVISFVPSRIVLADTVEGFKDSRMGDLLGKLTINGVGKDISFPVKYEFLPETLSIEGQLEIRYSDFNIDRPKVLGGLVKLSHKSIFLTIHWNGVQWYDEMGLNAGTETCATGVNQKR